MVDPVKYIIVDRSDGLGTSVQVFSTKEKMIEAIGFFSPYKDLKDVDVYEISGKIKLKKQPSIFWPRRPKCLIP